MSSPDDDNPYVPRQQLKASASASDVATGCDCSHRAGTSSQDLLNDLHATFSEGNSEAVTQWLARHVGRSYAELAENAQSPLHFLCQYGFADVLASFGDELNANLFSELHAGTLLDVAVRYGQTNVVELLLQKNAKQPDSLVACGTPLRAAAEQGNTDLVEILLKQLRAARPDQTSAIDSSVIFLYCQSGQHEALKSAWKDPLPPLDESLFNEILDLLLGDSDEVKSVVSACWSEPQRFLQILLLAAFQGVSEVVNTPEPKKAYRETLRFLFKHEAVVDEVIASQCFKEIIKFLNASTCNIDERDDKVLANWSYKFLSFIDYALWLQPMQNVIVELNLSKNPFKSLPDEIPWHLTALESFVVKECNGIRHIPRPAGIIQCTRLAKVVISQNKRLEIIPDALFDLKHLQHLDLSYNNIKCIPSDSSDELTIKTCTCGNLEFLNLSSNGLKVIRPSFLSGATGLKQLLLLDNVLERLPDPWKCPLVKLDAKHNKLNCLPCEMENTWNFKQTLISVDLSHNQLSTLPLSVGLLSSLVNLDLSHNLIEELPSPDKWTCSRLQTFNLSHNHFGLSQMKLDGRRRLRKLSSKSSLTSMTNSTSTTNANVTSTSATSSSQHIADIAFPTIFAERISALNFSHNSFVRVPPSICELTALSELDLSFNAPLTELPLELARLQSLDILHLADVDLVGYPINLNPKKSSGVVRTQEILAYLRSKLRQEEPYNQMKVLVVGTDNCGKSCLIRHLCIHPPKMAKDRSSLTSPLVVYKTILESNFGHSKKNPLKHLRLCIWELACAERFNAVHQCFMTDYALYILVFNLTKRPDFSKWLLNIRARSPHSAVIVVGTHLDVFQKQVASWSLEVKLMQQALSELQCRISECPKILNFIAVSNEAATNISNLKESIYSYCIEKLKETKVPKSYIDLRTKIEQAICEPQNKLAPWLFEEEIVALIPDDSDIRKGDMQEEIIAITNLFHRSGVFLHYSKNMRMLDAQYFYIDPIWLCDRLAKVIVDQESKRKMDLASIARLLSDNDCEPQDVEHLLELMRRFELLLFLKEDKVLIPSRLSREAPEIEFELRGPVLCRLYRMACTPPGFWSRLLVRLLTRLRDCKPQFHSRLQTKSDANAACQESGAQTLLNRRACTLIRQTNRDQLADSPWQIFYWSEGCVSQYANGCLRIESLRDSPVAEFLDPQALNVCSDGIVVLAASKHSRLSALDYAYFSLALDEVDTLIAEWFPEFDFGDERIRRFVICPSCVSHAWTAQFDDEAAAPTCVGCFQLEAVAACARKSMRIFCPVHENTVHLDHVIPDLLLRDVPDVEVITQLDKRQFLARGGQASIYLSSHGNEMVALKAFYEDKTLLASFDAQEDESAESSQGEPTVATQRVDTRLTRYYTSAERLGYTTSPRSFVPSAGASIVSSSISMTAQDERELTMLYAYQSMRKEVMFLSSLSHPHIISILGVVVQPEMPLCIVLEFAKQGNLFGFLEDQRKDKAALLENLGLLHSCLFDRTLTYKISWQIVAALSYLHSEGVLYRDLKGSNVLLWSDNVDDVINIKLSDYGISSYLCLQGLVGCPGSPGFQAPEVLKSMVYDDKADMFSYAMVLYQIFTGLVPFDDLNFVDDINRAVKREKRPSLKDARFLPDLNEIVDVMTTCWSNSPNQRLSSAEVRETMENVFFVLSRACLTFPKPDLRNRTPQQLARDTWRDSLTTSSAEIHVQAFAKQELGVDQLWCFSGRKNDRLATVVNVRECRFERENFPYPGECLIASAVVEHFLLCLTESANEPIEVFAFSKESRLFALEAILTPQTKSNSTANAVSFAAVKVSATKTKYILAIGTDEAGIALHAWDSASPREWHLVKQLQLTSSLRKVSSLTSLAGNAHELLAICGAIGYILNVASLFVEHTIRNPTGENFLFVAQSPEHLLLADSSSVFAYDQRCPHARLFQMVALNSPAALSVGASCLQKATSMHHLADEQPDELCFEETSNDTESRPSSALLRKRPLFLRQPSAIESLPELTVSPAQNIEITAVAVSNDILWIGRSDGWLSLIEIQTGSILATRQCAAAWKPKSVAASDKSVIVLLQRESSIFDNDVHSSSPFERLPSNASSFKDLLSPRKVSFTNSPRETAHQSAMPSPRQSAFKNTRHSSMSAFSFTEHATPATRTDYQIRVFEAADCSFVAKLRTMWHDLRCRETSNI